MVMFAGVDKKLTPNKGVSPISFGYNENPNDSLSPGAGNLASLGSTQSINQQQQGMPSSWMPNSSLSVTNLAPVNVSAATLAGAPMLGGLYGGGMGAPSGGSGAGGGGTGGLPVSDLSTVHVQGTIPTNTPRLGDLYGGSMGAPSGGGSVGGGTGGLSVTDLAPVHVQAQMPVKPTLLDQAWMWGNDHKLASSALQNGIAAVTPLGPVMVVANAYERWKHGQPIFGDLSNLGSNAGDMISGLFGGPGGPLSTNPSSPLYSDLYTSGVVGQPNMGGGTQSSGGGYNILSNGGALPYNPNGPGNFTGSAPVGGYWNQQAIRAAAPTYGPYAGFAQTANHFAPSGITY